MEQKPRDLVRRTFEFAQRVRHFVNQLPRTLANMEDAKQLVRASGSVAANYLEAQEGLSRKDFSIASRSAEKRLANPICGSDSSTLGVSPNLKRSGIGWRMRLMN